jgi:excalibur calcium-binding domain-containing protein
MRGRSTRARGVMALAVPVLAASMLTIGATASPAAAATVKAFANCTAMHKVAAFKGGIGRPHARDKRASGGRAKYAPYRSTRGYLLNSKSDRDKDGIACEV